MDFGAGSKHGSKPLKRKLVNLEISRRGCIADFRFRAHSRHRERGFRNPQLTPNGLWPNRKAAAEGRVAPEPFRSLRRVSSSAMPPQIYDQGKVRATRKPRLPLRNVMSSLRRCAERSLTASVRGRTPRQCRTARANGRPAQPKSDQLPMS